MLDRLGVPMQLPGESDAQFEVRQAEGLTRSIARTPWGVRHLIAEYEKERSECAEATDGGRRCARTWSFVTGKHHPEMQPRTVASDSSVDDAGQETKSVVVATPTPSSVAVPEPRRLDCSRYCMDDAKAMYEWLRHILHIPKFIVFESEEDEGLDRLPGFAPTAVTNVDAWIEFGEAVYGRVKLDHYDGKVGLSIFPGFWSLYPLEFAIEDVDSEEPMVQMVLQAIAAMFALVDVSVELVLSWPADPDLLKLREEYEASLGPYELRPRRRVGEPLTPFEEESKGRIARFEPPYFGPVSKWTLPDNSGALNRDSWIVFLKIDSSPRLAPVGQRWTSPEARNAWENLVDIFKMVHEYQRGASARAIDAEEKKTS